MLLGFGLFGKFFHSLPICPRNKTTFEANRLNCEQGTSIRGGGGDGKNLYLFLTEKKYVCKTEGKR